MLQLHRNQRWPLSGGFAWVAVVFVLASPSVSFADQGAIKVEIRKQGDRFELYRGGEPYFIKGAGYYCDPEGTFPLKNLAARGANSIRSRPVLSTLDAAHALGMSVLVNLPMRRQMDYNDEQAVRAQFEANRKRVLELKDHPAVLMWAIGNEIPAQDPEEQVWEAVNDIACMIHETDPMHPTLTVIGDGAIRYHRQLRRIRERAPDLDLIGINWYKGIEEVPEIVNSEGWTKPYIITEWGPTGTWGGQAPRTTWDASIDDTSTKKARLFVERYRAVMERDTARCLGSYAFIWQWRHERTHTWFGMHLESGESLATVDAMQYLWTGQWPDNQAPRVEPIRIDGQGAQDSVYLEPGSVHTATLTAVDPDDDALTIQWEVMPEVARAGYAGSGEVRSRPMPDVIRETGPGQLTFSAPSKEGAYRVFAYARDGQGHAATANIPFFVKAEVSEEGFVSLFNGQDLTGWDCLPDTWKVQDGAICSSGKKGKKNWIIWRGGELKDFELRLKFKFTAGNSGVQVRSREIAPFMVRGYQVEVAPRKHMGLWHHSLAPAKYRSHLATAGQKVHIAADGMKKTEQVAEPAEVQKAYLPEQWNELTIIATGSHLIQKINGRIFADLTDEDAQHASREGLLALQDHGGGTVAAFKDIRLKSLTD